MKKTLCALVMGATAFLGCSGKPNSPPVITSTPPKDIVVFTGEEFSYDVKAVDPDGEPLRYEFERRELHELKFSKDPVFAISHSFEEGKLRWTPKSQEYSSKIKVKVNDERGAYTTQEFDVYVVHLSRYINFAQHNLYVAQSAEFLEECNWYEAQEKAHKEKARIMTLKEYADFLHFLDSDNVRDGLGNKLSKKEVEEIKNSIYDSRYKESYEWIDAAFEKKNGTFYLNQNHKFIDGKLTPNYSEILKKTFKSNWSVDVEEWLTNANSQGMPRQDAPQDPRTARYIEFLAPENNNSVAKMGIRKARSGYLFAILDCNADPWKSKSSVVRLVYEKR
ncbi:MAG: hypothetical protein Q8R00_00550 [Candidatus Nanoarchaeia archaeon]|nr:hypothetical protein [Candidatus Nanoarchaeia archaeon]